MATAKTTTRKTRSTKPTQAKAQEAKAAEPAQKSTAAPAEGEAAPATDGPSQGDAAQGDVTPPESGEDESAKAPAKDPKDSRTPGEICGVFVRTKKRYGSRRRAGFRFTQEGLGIALSALSDEQLEQLHADPALEVEECTFPAEEDGEPEA